MSNASIKVSINIREGSLNLEADSAHLDAATESALKLMDRLLSARTFAQDGLAELADKPVDPSARPPISDNGDELGNRTKAKRKKSGGRTKNWQFKPTILVAADWSKVKEYYELKNPNTQNEKVAVIVSILAQLLGRAGVDGHEIHTTFKTLGEKTPANLTGVLGNMTGAGLGHSSEGKFQLDFAGNQMVDHDLPRTVGKKD